MKGSFLSLSPSPPLLLPHSLSCCLFVRFRELSSIPGDNIPPSHVRLQSSPPPPQKKRTFLVSCVLLTSDKIQKDRQTDKPKTGRKTYRQATENQEDSQPARHAEEMGEAGKRILDKKTILYGQAASQTTSARVGYHTKQHFRLLHRESTSKQDGDTTHGNEHVQHPSLQRFNLLTTCKDYPL